MLKLAQKLRQTGVLGINERNARFTLAYNPRRFYPLADNKLKTKQLACRFGLPVPELYGEISAFVIKPCHGSGGAGILLAKERNGEFFCRPEGSSITLSDLRHHISNILAGLYSLGAAPDSALIEYYVRPDPVFDDISAAGVPDVRIIVFTGVPVMAMLRLPTSQSHGKANLHQGAVGAGIDVSSGYTTSAVWKDSPVARHPDNGAELHGRLIPQWDRLLELAASCYEMNHLGYQGVDLVIDHDKGPLLLETNIRPGLSIQAANRAGLLPRLRAVQMNARYLTNSREKIRFAREKFGAEDLP